jgi:dTDP-4-dehydrorhamnose 3,5-epimerase
VPPAWRELELPGVWLRDLVPISDERGAFIETWRASWMGELPAEVVADWAGVAQMNLSRSHARVLRGLHFHQRQSDYWMVVDGRAFVALADLRPIVAGADKPNIATLELDASQALLIPENVAHGFWAHTPLLLAYLVTTEYDGSDEHGFAWNDPLAGIRWPDDRPILSSRDAANPSLTDALARLRPGFADPSG